MESNDFISGYNYVKFHSPLLRILSKKDLQGLIHCFERDNSDNTNGMIQAIKEHIEEMENE